ncbi:MAG TPA: ABC transporter permease subunit [Tepidisphaeraceae bacterium]|nr:ABC transporter permease subunit [Tepidisphaeraceae bacterium]
MLGITDYLWRLVPANPILLRVVESGGKRRRDLLIRCIYLGLLIAIVIFSLATSATSIGGMSVRDLSNASGSIFRLMSYFQLWLVALLAPIFTAGAITQEKDSQTYDILLATPLTNGQIVLGSLLSRLFFVIALLISGIPIFSVTQIFGGVAIGSIALSFGVAAATAFVTGALAMAIATFKVGTRRTIFSFYLFIAIYLVGGILLDQLDYFKVHLVDPVSGATTALSKTSWLTALNPHLAIRAIIDPNNYSPPDPALLPESLRGWPWGWYLSNPTSFYIWFMFFVSFVLVMPSIVLLRRMAQSTVSIKTWILQKLKISKGDRTRKPRIVWHNPIAWREAKTKASAARASILRYGFIAAGVIGAIVLVFLYSRESIGGKYISQGSYNAVDGTLFIDGDGGGTFKVEPNTQIKVGDSVVGERALTGRALVRSFSTTGKKNDTLATIDLEQIPRQLDQKSARQFLLGATIIEFAVILLIVTNAAASTVTREKEDGSLDLLLTTPITSRYYIWGKLRGLVSFVLPLSAVPVVSALLFILYDLFHLAASNDPAFKWIVFPEAIFILPGMLIVVVAFASILGMQMSLRCRTTVRAVMASVGIIIGLCGLLGWCGGQIVTSMGRGDNSIGVALASFSPFTVMTMLIDPENYGGNTFASGASSSDVFNGRILILIFSWVATAGYALAVWTMYKSMVKNFDMTIRRQSR